MHATISEKRRAAGTTDLTCVPELPDNTRVATTSWDPIREDKAMNRRFWCGALAALIVFGARAGSMNAQEGGRSGYNRQVMALPSTGFDTAAAMPEGLGPRQPIRDALHAVNLCCWSHHNHVGCGSLKAECGFIFGSCRTFFGETCLKGAPPPLPPGYNLGDNKTGSGNRAESRCDSCP
jgi:hypothetical protein